MDWKAADKLGVSPIDFMVKANNVTSDELKHRVGYDLEWLTDFQIDAINATLRQLLDWDQVSRLVIAISGFAGSGKSTMVTMMLYLTGIAVTNTYLCTPTGKAADKLRSLGLPAETYASVFFTPVTPDLNERSLIHYADRMKLNVALESTNSILTDYVSDIANSGELEYGMIDSIPVKVFNDLTMEAFYNLREIAGLDFIDLEDVQLTANEAIEIINYRFSKLSRAEKALMSKTSDINLPEMPLPRKIDSTDKSQLLNEVEFLPKSDVDTRALITVDEASMLDDLQVDVVADTFGMPLILMGDNFQCRPVNAKMNRYMVETDILLKDCQRSAGSIIEFTYPMRELKEIPREINTDYVLRISLSELMNDPDYYDLFMESDILIASKNKTCALWNARYRTWAGFEGNVPEVGERLNITRNDRESGLMNGSFVLVEKVHGVYPKSGYMSMDVRRISDNKLFRDISFSLASYDEDVREKIYYKKLLRYVGSDFGYCVTIYAVQGQEFDYIALIEERMPNMSTWDYFSNLYTATTRAKEGIIMIRQR